jgi:transcriptional regulator
MYVPAHFAMTPDQVHDALVHLGSADLVTQHEDGMVATFLPFFFDADVGQHGALLAHVARNNTQWSTRSLGESLVIAHISDHYVSPTWLPSAAGHANATPTWDYVTIHVYGQLIAHDDQEWTEDVVRRLTERNESELEVHWSVDDTNEGFVQAMLRAVVGIELRITRVEAKAKMSQNKPAADIEALADALDGRGDHAGATWLRDVSLPAAHRRAKTVAEVAAFDAARRAKN